jgi:integrase
VAAQDRPGTPRPRPGRRPLPAAAGDLSGAGLAGLAGGGRVGVRAGVSARAPRARLDSPEAPAIRAQLQAAPRLRDEKVSLVLKRLASRAGLADPDRYSSHSTRRGFAAELRRHGASDLEIAAAGGWQRLDQVRRYATSAAIWHDPPAARLGL